MFLMPAVLSSSFGVLPWAPGVAQTALDWWSAAASRISSTAWRASFETSLVNAVDTSSSSSSSYETSFTRIFRLKSKN